MDIKEIYIKNFRNIGEEGAEIKLSPITIFTGCNSAGKSTAAKALLLLESYLSDLKANNYNFIDTPLDFSKVVKLGSFDSVLNKTSKSNGEKDIVFGYSFASSIIVADFKVRLYFGKKETDALNNAYLKALSIFIDSNELVSVKIMNGFYSCLISNIEKFLEYIRYYKIRHIVNHWKVYDNTLKMEEELVRKSFQQTNPAYDEKKEKLRPIMPELLSLDERLISERVVRAELKSEDRDENFPSLQTVADVASVIEDIIDLEFWWYLCIKWEQTHSKRLTQEDISDLMENIYRNINPEKKQLDVFPRTWERLSAKIDWELKAYIQSGTQNIIEYKRLQNISAVKIFINSLNQTEDQTVFSFSDKEQKIGFLELIDNIGEDSSQWVSRVFEYILKRCLTPNLCGKVGYVDSATIDVRRMYPLDSTDRFGNLWKRFNDMKTRLQLSESDAVERGSFLREWLHNFDICEDLYVDNVEGAIRIKLITKDNPEGRLLADFGYGVTQLVALLLNIEIAINGTEPKVVGVDTCGMSVDVIVDYNPFILILEEPEVHLHPNLQSKLADLFLAATRYGVHFIVETHSEYLVRRTQVLVNQLGITADFDPRTMFKVFYFPNDGLPYDMRYKANGHFMESFGEGFFDEAGKWSRELMRSKNK